MRIDSEFIKHYRDHDMNPVDPGRFSLRTITGNSETSKSEVSGRCLKKIAIYLESHERYKDQ